LGVLLLIGFVHSGAGFGLKILGRLVDYLFFYGNQGVSTRTHSLSKAIPPGKISMNQLVR